MAIAGTCMSNSTKECRLTPARAASSQGSPRALLKMAARARRPSRSPGAPDFEQKRDALQLWHEHLDKKVLKGHLIEHVRQAVEGKKQFEEAMKLNMKLGPHSEAHKVAVRRRAVALARERRSA